MKKNLIFILSFILVAFAACNNDDDTNTNSISVSFAVPSLYLTDDVTPIQVVFSSPAPEAGSLTISFVATQVAYGTDFSTNPAAVTSTIVVPFAANASGTTFNLNKLVNVTDDQVRNVVFTINEVSFGNSLITGNSSIQVNFNETASLGQALAAEVGGPNQPNQVYIDLSSGAMATAPRTSWDLGFYSGSEFRVALNYSVKMAAKQLETTNIDEVQAEDESMLIGQGQGNANQIDNPAGAISGTTIAQVSDNDADNKVYLINLGSNPSTTVPAVGTEGSASGSHRGWKKIRILKSGNDYKIQYADINATTHQEKIISKNSAFNFTFFSFTSNNVVNVEPQKNQWDLNFTTFTNLVSLGGPAVPYHYPDFVVTNLKGGAKAYMVVNAEGLNYDIFTLANVTEANFNEDQRNIGSNWRSTSAPGPNGTPVSQFVLRTDRFFVIKDPAGNIYKLRFTGGANEAGERGYPKFQYALLQ